MDFNPLSWESHHHFQHITIIIAIKQQYHSYLPPSFHIDRKSRRNCDCVVIPTSPIHPTEAIDKQMQSNNPTEPPVDAFPIAAGYVGVWLCVCQSVVAFAVNDRKLLVRLVSMKYWWEGQTNELENLCLLGHSPRRRRRKCVYPSLDKTKKKKRISLSGIEFFFE